jgi:hypothetical protein
MAQTLEEYIKLTIQSDRQTAARMQKRNVESPPKCHRVTIQHQKDF